MAAGHSLQGQAAPQVLLNRPCSLVGVASAQPPLTGSTEPVDSQWSLILDSDTVHSSGVSATHLGP